MLTILFAAALTTAFALDQYLQEIEAFTWLVLFIPLVISSGGNSGNQSATLVITAPATGDVHHQRAGRHLRVALNPECPRSSGTANRPVIAGIPAGTARTCSGLRCLDAG